MSCLINPKTKRAVKQGSKLYKQLKHDRPLDRRCRINPRTNRAVQDRTLSFSSRSPPKFRRLRKGPRTLSFSPQPLPKFKRLRKGRSPLPVLKSRSRSPVSKSQSPIRSKVLSGTRSRSPKVLSGTQSRSPKVLSGTRSRSLSRTQSRSPKVLSGTRSRPKIFGSRSPSSGTRSRSKIFESRSPKVLSRSRSACEPDGYQPGAIVQSGNLQVRNSYIPDAGLGLFAVERIPRLSVITEYGGKVVDRKEAIALRQAGLDTHVRAIAKGHESLDGRVQPGFSKEYYAKNDLLGSFANQAMSPKEQNAKFVRKDQGKQHPSGEWASGRILLKATKDIEPGCEILVNYGKTYKQLHF